MCEFCGIASALKPESSYWRKMCEYITNGGRSFQDSGVSLCSRCDYFEKEIAGKKCVAVLNGNIKNCDILRQSLQFKGVVFKTANAAEVVLNTYLAYGKSIFKSYHGEFSGIIWDGYENELILFRDKVGFKRLFYYFDGQRLTFASDIKDLFKFPVVKKEPSDDVYCKLFTLSGSNFVSETFFKNIYELQPAYYVSFKCGKIKLKNYFMFDYKCSSDSFSQTVKGFDFFVKDKPVLNLTEVSMSKNELYEKIIKYLEKSFMPSPYVTLADLSDFGNGKKLICSANLFTIPKRFKLPLKMCEANDREFINNLLSNMPEFPYNNEKDIATKEEMYIIITTVLPKVIAAKRLMHPGFEFPYLDERVLEYSIKSEKHKEKLLKSYFAAQKVRPLKENTKALKALFSEMIKDDSFMCGMIQKEEILRFTRLFPRPETMLYLIQVDMWLKMFL